MAEMWIDELKLHPQGDEIILTDIQTYNIAIERQTVTILKKFRKYANLPSHGLLN